MKLQEIYGGMTAEERPQQLLRAEMKLAEAVWQDTRGGDEIWLGVCFCG